MNINNNISNSTRPYSNSFVFEKYVGIKRFNFVEKIVNTLGTYLNT